MCCLFTFHGVMGRLSHCCIIGKHLYRKNDVKKSQFCNNLCVPAVRSADFGTTGAGWALGRIGFSAKPAVPQDRAGIFFPLPFAF